MDKYTVRFSPLVYEELRNAFEYWAVHNLQKTAKEFVVEIQEEFELIRSHPKLKQVVSINDEFNHVYRRVNVWRFAFLYRIDEERRELVIERIYHERLGG